MYYSYFEAPIGRLLIVGDAEALLRICFPRKGKPVKPEAGWTESARGPIGKAIRQLREYFRGKRIDFDLPLAPRGTPFQLAVWRGLQEIPYGRTASYGEIARRVGN